LIISSHLHVQLRNYSLTHSASTVLITLLVILVVQVAQPGRCVCVCSCNTVCGWSCDLWPQYIVACRFTPTLSRSGLTVEVTVVSGGTVMCLAAA